MGRSGNEAVGRGEKVKRNIEFYTRNNRGFSKDNPVRVNGWFSPKVMVDGVPTRRLGQYSHRWFITQQSGRPINTNRATPRFYIAKRLFGVLPATVEVRLELSWPGGKRVERQNFWVGERTKDEKAKVVAEEPKKVTVPPILLSTDRQILEELKGIHKLMLSFWVAKYGSLRQPPNDT
jgi:hypothetical protein